MSAGDRVLADARELLVEARKLIDKPEHWTQSAPARTHCGGMQLPPRSPHATCWCLTGAIDKAAHDRDAEKLIAATAISFLWTTVQARRGLRLWSCAESDRRWSVHDLQTWNDHQGRKHADVLAILDATIARASAAPEGAAA